MRVRNNKGNVFVGNLPLAFSDERLAETFDPYGIVLSAAVARDPETGARLRYGFVDIATEKAATLAITALDGSEVDGCKLNVKMSERKAKNGAKKPGATPGRRPPFRAAPPRRTPVGGAAETPVRRDPAGIAERIARPTPNGRRRAASSPPNSARWSRRRGAISRSPTSRRGARRRRIFRWSAAPCPAGANSRRKEDWCPGESRDPLIRF